MSITDIEEIEGKTVSKVITSYDDMICIHFADNECIIMSAGPAYDGVSELEIIDSDSLSDYHSHELGLISTEEYKALCKKYELNLKKRKEADERSVFKRLKAKYDEKDASK